MSHKVPFQSKIDHPQTGSTNTLYCFCVFDPVTYNNNKKKKKKKKKIHNAHIVMTHES